MAHGVGFNTKENFQQAPKYTTITATTQLLFQKRFVHCGSVKQNELERAAASLLPFIRTYLAERTI